MGLKFYFAPYSTANVTVAVFDELESGLPEPLAERVQLSLKDKDTRTPEFLANVNPNGHIPAIVHDGVSIWESSAITLYLGETFGANRVVDGKAAPLYPAPGPQRGEAMKWVVWSNIHLGTQARRLQLALAAENNEEKDSATEAIMKSLAILNSELQGKEFIVGSSYSIVDTHVWSFVVYMPSILKVDLTSVPNVIAYISRISSRPQLQAVKP